MGYQLEKLRGHLLPACCHLRDAIWELGRQIVRLRAVVAQIVQLPRIALCRDELPIAGPQGTISFVQPPQRVTRQRAIVAKSPHEAATGRGRNGKSVELRGPAAAGQLYDGRHKSTTCPTACRRNSPVAAIPAGQCAIRGVAMPPSCTHVLWRRKGVLAAQTSPARHTNNWLPIPARPRDCGRPREP